MSRAETIENSQVFDYGEYFRWSYLLPTVREASMIFVTVAALSLLFTLPVAQYDLAAQLAKMDSDFERFVYVFADAAVLSTMFGAKITLLMSYLTRLVMFLSSRFFFNRGHYFIFEAGQLKSGTKVVKFKEMLHWINGDYRTNLCKESLAN